MKPDDRQIVTAWLPRGLYEWLRATAYDQRTTMTKLIIDALQAQRGDGNGVPD